MCWYDYDDYGTRMEPLTSTWQTEGLLYIDGNLCPGETSMMYESTSQYVTGTVSRFVDWNDKCLHGHELHVYAVDGGNKFRSGTVLKQEAPCDGSCPDPISWDDEGNIDYIHKTTRYVCAACLTAGSVVQVSMQTRPESYHRAYSVSQVMRFTSGLFEGVAWPEVGHLTLPFVLQLSKSVHPDGWPSWIEGEVSLIETGNRGRSESYAVWVSYDELAVKARESGAPTMPLTEVEK